MNEIGGMATLVFTQLTIDAERIIRNSQMIGLILVRSRSGGSGGFQVKMATPDARIFSPRRSFIGRKARRCAWLGRVWAVAVTSDVDN